MARRNKDSPAEEVFDMLVSLPSWFGPVLACFVYLFFRFILPAVVGFGSRQDESRQPEVGWYIGRACTARSNSEYHIVSQCYDGYCNRVCNGDPNCYYLSGDNRDPVLCGEACEMCEHYKAEAECTEQQQWQKEGF